MKMSIRITIAVVGVMLVLGGLGAVKGLQIGRMISQSEAFVPPLQVVTAATVARSRWESTMAAVGSLEAVQGVMVTAELAGKVTRIAFQSGAWVKSGRLLLQQDVSEEKARLRAAESRSRLARKNMERARLLIKEQVITESTLDDREAAYEQAVAEVENIRAVIAKKTIRAPFSGRLGIRHVDVGEVLESGQQVVSLQAMDPIFVNFQLPQQKLIELETGLLVRARTSGKDDIVVEGRITALNPDVNPDTRNVQVQATLPNTDERLRPGMFASVQVLLPDKQPVLTVPATAVLYAPYSDSVFVVESKPTDTGQTQQVLRQQFVQLGEKRGDFVAVTNGLQAGQRVVSTGVFKLRNGMPVSVDNALSPAFELNPEPDNA
jgi:membrane fusion protein (multidrug efflux system)